MGKGIQLAGSFLRSHHSLHLFYNSHLLRLSTIRNLFSKQIYQHSLVHQIKFLQWKKIDSDRPDRNKIKKIIKKFTRYEDYDE